MSKTQRWLALVIALALLVGTLAPTTALAIKGDNNLDLSGEPPYAPPLEYGDPEPGGSGRPLVWEYISLWIQIETATMRVRYTMVRNPVRASHPKAGCRSDRMDQGTNP